MYRFYTEIEIKGFDSIVKNFILSDQAPYMKMYYYKGEFDQKSLFHSTYFSETKA
jgi:hypothetical protein